MYQDRLAKGLIKMNGEGKRKILPTAKTSLYIFCAAIVAVVAYATMISGSVGLIENPTIGRNEGDYGVNADCCCVHCDFY